MTGRRGTIAASAAVCALFSVAAAGCPWPRPKPPTTPTTTTVAATTTTAAPTTTMDPDMPMPSTTAPSTVPGTSNAWTETFADPQAFYTRFDHGWSGEVQAGALFGGAQNDWMGDHDMSCGNPNETHRTIHVTPPANEPGAPSGSKKDVEQAFYACAPGGDASKAHVMTSVDTEGYVIAWFSPKPVFTNVRRVCWDQNTTNLGGGKWTQVVFLTQPEYTRLQGGQVDLGYTSPEFPAGGPSTPQGTARFGLRMGRNAAIEAWADGQFFTGLQAQLEPDNNRAPRYQHCVVDNENGTLTASVAQPNGTVKTGTIQGQIPNGQIRIVFEDDTYNNRKHMNQDGIVPDGFTWAWHWDGVIVETR